MARQNPTIDKSNKGLKGVIDGVDPLPNAIGINHDALSEANAMPEVDMSPNNGDNPTIADAPFATGTDRRNHTGGSNSAPAPSRVGAGI